MRTHLFAALAGLALAGCGDPAGSDDSQQGLLRFDYSGAATGSYRAEAPSQDTTGNAPWALARANPFGLEISSRSDGQAAPVVRVRMVTVSTSTGRYPVSLLCDVFGPRCLAGTVEFTADGATGQTRGTSCNPARWSSRHPARGVCAERSAEPPGWDRRRSRSRTASSIYPSRRSDRCHTRGTLLVSSAQTRESTV